MFITSKSDLQVRILIFFNYCRKTHPLDSEHIKGSLELEISITQVTSQNGFTKLGNRIVKLGQVGIDGDYCTYQCEGTFVGEDILVLVVDRKVEDPEFREAKVWLRKTFGKG